MDDSENQEIGFFYIKIIQSGEITRILLTNANLSKNFKEIYIPLLKELKLKEKSVFFSLDSGKMLKEIDYSLSLEKIIEKFGNRINLYYEKIM